MKQVIIFILVLMLLTSCDKGLTVYQMRILIKNDTDSSMKVTLYPKSKYVRYGMYSYSDMHTKYKDTTFIPDMKLGTEIYSTDTLDMDPQILINRVFDSMKVILSSGKILKFSSLGVVNYPMNPFSDKSAWIYQKNILEHVRTWRDNNVESEDYIFIIAR
ncbi:MAG TPA: hypothetical protein VMV47_09945 [Bacteroidales bacterium]|nr:hypothetical protein [Bacteroidales bacterium]